jgi:hypothetical protein
LILEDVIHLAKYSELSSVAIKDDTMAILSFINLGIVELYKRFPIKRVEHVISIEENQTLYSMPSDFMYATSAFQKVMDNEKLVNQDISINNELFDNSIFFPTYNQVQIPESLDIEEITVVYVPKPVKYTRDSLEQDIDLPEVLIDCLLSYVGYKGHLGIRSDSQSENNSHALRFERSIKKAKELGVCPSTDYYRSTNKINSKGFV